MEASFSEEVTASWIAWTASTKTDWQLYKQKDKSKMYGFEIITAALLPNPRKYRTKKCKNPMNHR